MYYQQYQNPFTNHFAPIIFRSSYHTQSNKLKALDRARLYFSRLHLGPPLYIHVDIVGTPTSCMAALSGVTLPHLAVPHVTYSRPRR
jgi:hypothetical protein